VIDATPAPQPPQPADGVVSNWSPWSGWIPISIPAPGEDVRRQPLPILLAV
jgi:hypothetical protein